MENLIMAAKLYFLGGGLYFVFAFFVKNKPRDLGPRVRKEFTGADDTGVLLISILVAALVALISICAWWIFAIEGLYKSLKGANAND